ncbi:MAG TPA: aldo/keto reductase, partial [Halococcus sp.]|nr:aldo/keto reductase [Halococcus sp.]
KHDASEAQVSLAWLREKGITAIPKATGEDHIRGNWESHSIDLDSDDIETIDAIGREERQVDPDFAPW